MNGGLSKIAMRKQLLRAEHKRLIERMVLKAGTEGLTARQISSGIQRSVETVLDILRELEAAGKFEKNHDKGGRGCAWGAIGIRARADAIREQRAAQRVHNAALRRNCIAGRAKVSERVAADSLWADEWIAANPTRRTIPAANAPRMHLAAIPSVWALAAHA